MRSRWFASLLVLSVLTGFLPAATYHVDDDAPGDPGPCNPQVSDPNEDGSADHPFDDIQEAIDAAWTWSMLSSVWPTGDTIIVAPGHYLSPDPWEYDEIRFKGESIRLVGSAPTDFSVIEKTILCGVVIFQGTEDPNCLLQGFKIQNHGHGGILGNNTKATISHCIISGNGPCGATVVKDVWGPVRNCLIVDNTTFHNCGVMPVVWGCAELVNCTIANNISGVNVLGKSARPSIRNCIIYGNQDPVTVSGATAAWPMPNYSLIDEWASGGLTGTMDADPCFVRLGYWVDDYSATVPAPRDDGRTTSTRSRTTISRVLIEGDYHLKSQGWRWSEETVHGSHWYFDTATSPAIDAGRRMDGLGEELERAPDDPEGRWGVNHAIDLGAYGGTSQASLAPSTRGGVPGVGTVDLRDYWSFSLGNQWLVHNPEKPQIARQLRVAMILRVNGFPIFALYTLNAPTWAPATYCVYVDQTMYMTQSTTPLNLLPDTSSQFQAQYPVFPVIGATITAPYDPFVFGTSQRRSAVVTRGSLEDVLAGTDLDLTQFVAGDWPDVIALREVNTDGTTGGLTTIFARGFGPLMVAGQPVERATVDGESFQAASAPTSPVPARR